MTLYIEVNVKKLSDFVTEVFKKLNVEVKDAIAVQTFQREEMSKNQINDQIQ